MRVVKLGSKIVQVKGVMPLSGGLTRETPTGRAVGGFVVWHNFFEDLEEVMPVFIVKPQIISGDFRRLFQTETPVTVCGQ